MRQFRNANGTDLRSGEICQPGKNLRVVEGFIAGLEVLNYGNEAAIHTGQIRAELAKAGTPVGPYDSMIAAHARSLGLILVTNNTHEFVRISGLRRRTGALIKAPCFLLANDCQAGENLFSGS